MISGDIVNETSVNFGIGAIVGLFGWFFGGLDGFFKVLLTFAVIDYFSGLSVAIFVNHNLSSTVGFKGITKKCLMFSFVGIAHILDKYLLGGTRALRTAVCLFYIGNEGISVIENTDALGIPFPQMLKDRFLGLKENKYTEKAESKREAKRHSKRAPKRSSREAATIPVREENSGEDGVEV